MEISTILIIILSFFVIILFVWNIQTEKRLKTFWRGKSGASLENTFVSIIKDIEALEGKESELKERVLILEDKIKQSIRGTDLIRFNPFKDAGSNQSFAVAFVNEEDDGVIFSSLYARDRMSVFAKEIKSGVAGQDITVEEKSVLDNARKKIR